MSTGTSLVPCPVAGRVLVGRLGGGDSGGLGWVRVKGNSTDRSLKKIIIKRSPLVLIYENIKEKYQHSKFSP